MNQQRFSTIRFIAVLLTLFVLVGERLLPAKEFVFYPDEAKLIELFSDESAGGNSRAYWIDEANGEWECELRESPVYTICGLSMSFSDVPYKVQDLSDYSSVKINLDYSGPATRIRVYIRNHNVLYSTRRDIESAKFMSVTLRTSDFQPEATIQLSEFYVADWWKEQFNIPRELSQPDFRQVISFGIDQAQPLAYGDHKYKLKSIVFVGDWISSEILYLSIIVSWLIIFGFQALGRIVYLGDRAVVDPKRLSQLQWESQHYRKLSTTDALTGAPNRAGAQQRVNAILQERLDLTGYSLLVIDIDHFKRINDQRGHDAGDRILKAFAKRLAESVRGDDFFARWGGEEFLLLAKTGDAAQIASLAEKLRAMIHVYIFEPERPLKLSVSVGCAVAERKEAFEEVFRRADEALYRAKSQGRNCVVVDKYDAKDEVYS